MDEVGRWEWQNLILFRDYLTQHPDVAEEYARLKMELAEKFPKDRQTYLEGKAPFVERVLKLARSD